MKKHILWAIVAVLLLHTGPALTQNNDDDKFAKPQIDVISDIIDQTEPVETKSPQEKDQKRHPEDIGTSTQDSRTETDATDVTDSAYTDMSEGADIDAPRPGRRSRRKRANEEPIAAPEIIKENQTPEKPPLEPEPAVQPPTQPQAAKPAPVNPQPTAQQPTQQGQVPQGQVPPPAKPNVPGQPGQANIQQQAPAPEKPQQQPPVEQQQPPVQKPPVNTQGNAGQQPQQPAQTQPPVQNQQAKPVEQAPPTPAQQQQANQHIPEAVPVKTPEPVPEPVNVPPVQPAQPVKPTQPAQPAQAAQPAAPVKQEPVKPATNTPRVDDMMDEEQYLNLYGQEDNYLDKYTVYSETFYTHVEKFCKEALVPVYHHIRTTPELSLGFSTLVVIYLVNLFFRILGRIFRKKPKFVYNKEEVMSHADINNNFKKFVAELDNLKKQLDTNAKKGGSTVAHSSGEPSTPATAAIPQSLQNEISYIAQNLSKNDDLFNKISKDRKQLDSFLFEFQKEVVESHKAIWNELYQLRKVFSQSKLNMSTSSLKARSEARDTDDTKSLSSNPDTETRRREDREPVKKSAEPRSRSVAGPETGALRSRPAAPKERKPVLDAEPEKPASALQNGNSAEPHVPHTRKEEPHVEKAPAQDPFAAKQPEPEETQPEEVQIPTYLSDKAPTHNPFATSAQNQTTPVPAPVNQNAGPTPGPGIGMGGPKGIPFGAKGRPPVVRQPVIQTTFPQAHGLEPNAVNSGAKAEHAELNSGLKPTTPTPVLNTMPPIHAAPVHAEPHQERTEEKSALPETDHAPEETKAAERLSGADEMLAGGPAGGEEDGANDVTSATRPGIPQLRSGPPGPMGGPMGGPPGQRKPVIPTNKALPIPGRKPGLPGANVFKGPPGNIPRAAVPTQIKQPQGQVQDTAPKTGV